MVPGRSDRPREEMRAVTSVLTPQLYATGLATVSGCQVFVPLTAQ